MKLNEIRRIIPQSLTIAIVYLDTIIYRGTNIDLPEDIENRYLDLAVGRIEPDTFATKELILKITLYNFE